MPARTDPQATGEAVRVENATVRFPARDGSTVMALDGCSLEVPAGSFTVVIGPNGCGKSTLLRLIAGLLRPHAGSVVIGAGDGRPPHPGDGRVGIAFQQPRLLPWLSTLDNVALPLALHGGAAVDRDRRAREALARVGLAAAADLRPRELSGGMAQRAGLARALIDDPPVLLLDEPFSALDALSREAFDSELQALSLERPRTVVLVTHSVPEAVRLADRIAVMTPRPGSVARMVQVELPRPRPVSADDRARRLEAEVRETLESVHAPELASWTATA